MWQVIIFRKYDTSAEKYIINYSLVNLVETAKVECFCLIWEVFARLSFYNSFYCYLYLLEHIIFGNLWDSTGVFAWPVFLLHNWRLRPLHISCAFEPPFFLFSYSNFEKFTNFQNPESFLQIFQIHMYLFLF